jgi:hypothetical protein
MEDITGVSVSRVGVVGGRWSVGSGERAPIKDFALPESLDVVEPGLRANEPFSPLTTDNRH